MIQEVFGLKTFLSRAAEDRVPGGGRSPSPAQWPPGLQFGGKSPPLEVVFSIAAVTVLYQLVFFGCKRNWAMPNASNRRQSFSQLIEIALNDPTQFPLIAFDRLLRVFRRRSVARARLEP